MIQNLGYRRWSFILVLSACVCASHSAFALPFSAIDARSLAMGGVGVATGTHNAVFTNPALLVTADEIHEWFLLLPTVGENSGDPDKLKDGLDVFQTDADTLDASPTVLNRDATQGSLDDMDGSQYRYGRNIAIMLAVPSRILSGAAFLNTYESSNATPAIGGDDLTNPASPIYNSTMIHRGMRIVENGVSAAKVLEFENKWLRNIAVGFNAKFLLIETYGYEESIRTAEVKVDRSGRSNYSQFGLDLGLMKEFGVWKLGITGKNLLSGKYEYGTSGDAFNIEPQVRAGFAYQSRRSVLELDVDLTENKPVGLDSPSKVAAIGWEWQAARWLFIRAGLNKNIVGTRANYSSVGIGFLMGGFHIDMSGYTGTEGKGLSGQMGFQF